MESKMTQGIDAEKSNEPAASGEVDLTARLAEAAADLVLEILNNRLEPSLRRKVAAALDGARLVVVVTVSPRFDALLALDFDDPRRPPMRPGPAYADRPGRLGSQDDVQLAVLPPAGRNVENRLLTIDWRRPRQPTLRGMDHDASEYGGHVARSDCRLAVHDPRLGVERRGAATGGGSAARARRRVPNRHPADDLVRRAISRLRLQAAGVRRVAAAKAVDRKKHVARP
jgi:hypothetical protein